MIEGKRSNQFVCGCCHQSPLVFNHLFKLMILIRYQGLTGDNMVTNEELIYPNYLWDACIIPATTVTLCLKLWISQHICSKWKYRNVVILMDKRAFVRQQDPQHWGAETPSLQYREDWHLPWRLVDLSLSEELVWLGGSIFNSFSLSCRNTLFCITAPQEACAFLSSLSRLFTTVFDGAGPRPPFRVGNHLGWVQSLWVLEKLGISVSLVRCRPGRETKPRKKHSWCDFRQRRDWNSRASYTQVSCLDWFHQGQEQPVIGLGT